MIRLYRVFRAREHADAFLAGRVRFGHLGYYQSLEDPARGDAGEGHALVRELRQDRMAVRIEGGRADQVRAPGFVDLHAEAGNAVYVCCLALPPDDAAWRRVREEFGPIVVEIDDAERLRDDLIAALDPENPWQRRAPIVLWPAEYTKGLEAPAVPREQRDPLRLSIVQKLPAYCYQFEHRLALISYGQWQVDGRPPQFQWVTLPGPIGYARLV